MKDLKNKTVVIAGIGISGIGAARLLDRAGADIIMYDGNDKINIEDIEKKLDGIKARIITGDFDKKYLHEAELLVISPGVPVDSPLVEMFKAEKIPVWGEIELAYNYEKGSVIAITGTNGKTTTTALVGQIVKAYNEKTFVVGNIGTPYTGEVLNTTEKSWTVAEISSFQLETVHTFAPKVSAILNITPDHLDRHHTMECYEKTKENITINQTKNNYCVLNYDDEKLRRYGENCNATVIWFSRLEVPETGAYVEGDVIKYKNGSEITEIINVRDMQLIGVHNYENVCAAVAITMSAGIPADIIREQIRCFKAVAHRIEYVATKNGVVYYNDSKGTNPEAAVRAIEAMSRPTVLIGGGYDKGSEFDMYVKAFKDKVKLLVLMGQTAQKLADTAKKYGFENIIFVESMQEAVEVCARNADSGDAVLLSPACASWGMFKNYEQRGDLFKEYVDTL